MAAGWRYVLLALGIVTPGFAWLLGAILCWGAFFRTRRRGQLPVAPVHWLRWAVVFSVLGLIVQASSNFGPALSPGAPLLHHRPGSLLRSGPCRGHQRPAPQSPGPGHLDARLSVTGTHDPARSPGGQRERHGHRRIAALFAQSELGQSHRVVEIHEADFDPLADGHVVLGLGHHRVGATQIGDHSQGDGLVLLAAPPR